MNILSQSGPFSLFFAFAIAHALADFPLQGNYLASTKRRDQASNTSEWIISLTAHSLIQAGGVWIVSGSVLLGAAEFCLHWLIDFGKGEGGFGYATDQCIHLACKLGYVILLVFGMVHVCDAEVRDFAEVYFVTLAAATYRSGLRGNFA